MKIDEFFSAYNYKPIDYDGAYGFQCMDLYHKYVSLVLPGYPHPSQPGAAWIWDTYDPKYYDRIVNTPLAIPQKGDILIWGKSAGGGYGHVAVYSSGNLFNFVSFDQNWPNGSYCHFQGHNYFGGLLGWIRPKQPSTGTTDRQTLQQIRIVVDTVIVTGKQDRLSC